MRGWPSWGSVGALFTALDIGGDSDKGKQLRRSERINEILKETVGYFAKDEQ